jgi:hypothetical protein
MILWSVINGNRVQHLYNKERGDIMNILSTNWKSTQWKPNNTLEITLPNDYVIILKDVSFANYLALSSNPTLLDKMILSRTNW